jgi:hypothetical protein
VLTVVAVVIAAAIVIGLNMGGRPGVSAQPSGTQRVSDEPTTTPSAGATATETATPTAPPPPAAASLAWERLDGALEPDARVLTVTNLSGRWFAGGRVGDAPAIWGSDDDEPHSWTATTLDTAGDEDHYAQVTDIHVSGDSLVAVGSWGLVGSDQFSRISWLSTDGGATWAEWRSDDPALRAVAGGGPGLVGASWSYGGTLPFDSFIELSADGINWERIAPESMRNSQVDAITVLGDRLVAVGGAFDESGLVAAAWYSDDAGRTWTAGEIDGSGNAADVTQLGQGLVAVGGSGVPTAWTTEDGLTWTSHQIAPAGFAAAVSAVESGGVVVVGNNGPQDILEELAWSSVDGVTWQDAGAMPPAESQMSDIAAYGIAVVAGGTCRGDEACPTPLWLGLPAE